MSFTHKVLCFGFNIAVFKFVEHPENNENLLQQKCKVKFKILSLKVKGPMDYAPELVLIISSTYSQSSPNFMVLALWDQHSIFWVGHFSLKRWYCLPHTFHF